MPDTRKNPWIKVAISLVVFIFCLETISYSQCISSGAKNPATAASVSYSGSGFSFSNPSRVFASDDMRSTASSLLSLLNGKTEYLQATNFGFSIPATAAICGIQVDVERSASQIGNILFLEAWVADNVVKLVKGGTVSGADRAMSTHWGTTETTITYGSSSDLWGTTWMPSDINSGNFGVAFSADVRGIISGLASLLPEVNIDNIRITVSYIPDALLQLRLSDFTIVAADNTASVTWKADNDNSTTLFELQRSSDGATWEKVEELIHKTQHGSTGMYNAVDNNPYAGKSFYRLRMTPKGGQATYSESKAVFVEGTSQVRAYPNPFTSSLHISGVEPNSRLFLYNEYGQIVYNSAPKTGTTASLELATLKNGIYFLVAGGKRIKVIKQ